MQIPLTPGHVYTEGQALPLRILAIAEGYVMARFKGCTPFVESVDKFQKRLELFAKTLKNHHHE